MNVELEIGFSFKRDLPEGHRHLTLEEGSDVETALRALADRYDGIRDRLFDEDGSIRRHINALINGGNVRLRGGFQTELHGGDRLTILPPIGGG